MRQTGGSVASDAVTSLVTKDTYSSMNSAFTNNYTNGGGKQCGGGMKKCPTCGGAYKKKSKKPKEKDTKAKAKKGGGTNTSAATSALSDFMSSLAKSTSAAMHVKAPFVNSVFQSQPASALNSVLPRNVGLQHNVNSKSHFTETPINVSKPTMNSFVDPLKVANVNVMKNPFTNQHTTQEHHAPPNHHAPQNHHATQEHHNIHHGGKKPSKKKTTSSKKKPLLPKKKV